MTSHAWGGVIKLSYGIEGRRIHFFRVATDNIIINIELNYVLKHKLNYVLNLCSSNSQYNVNEIVSCVGILVVYFQEDLKFQKVPSSNLFLHCHNMIF